MRVFVTGATGFIGSAVVDELLSAGHTVLGLVRSDDGANQVESQGAESLRGTIEDLDLLADAASKCDAVIHLAFILDFADIEGCCAKDRAAITAMGDALVSAGGDKALVSTTATMMLQHGKVGREEDGPDMTNSMLSVRGASEPVCLAYANKGIRASAVRIPPTAHGEGQSGLMGYLVDAALQKGISAYASEYNNRWSACHRNDVAKLYRMAIERAEPGSTFHAVAEEGVAIKDIAAEISKHLDVPLKGLTQDELQEHFGWIAFGVSADNPISSASTQERLGWTPTGPTALEDVPTVIKFKQSTISV
ncbi:putative oxidoreductase [Pseudovirgaria hyperparasitica]|uniref:Putative oxidoreductase n=1 Tax=Pseudovirgaria hyperparasitica TaxID=470096 RepID=A0A6A6W8M2_9PEZI|nr:putative oxidoreductase [Pseudovirgaria hyperparasitica]KAF2759202.1 putative oxidoreductase [Pseudovirgaria hyperparasitica]